MSTPSTPVCSQLSRDGSTSNVLTPGRQVQALLAQFDDSDSDASIAFKNTRRTPSAPSELAQSKFQAHLLHSQHSEASASAEDASEEDSPVARRGRLATRLYSPVNAQESPARSEEGGSRNERRAVQHAAASTEGSRLRVTVQGSDDELSGTAPTRRLLLKRKRDPTSASPASATFSRDASLVLPTPAYVEVLSPVPCNADVDSDRDKPLPASNVDGKSKFLALVEKNRKQRMAMEAAEIAKRAARVEQLNQVSKNSRSQRGSSVANSSGDDTLPSDEDAGSRLAKEARPTRKASKKALEEMHRETQRMSRNMQLAHQARTKKKITKESLLALFDFPVFVPVDPINAGTKTSTASSAPTSDAEGGTQHVTPPTSPVVGDDEARKEAVQECLDEEMLLELDELTSQPLHIIDRGKGRATAAVPDSAVEVREPVLVRPIRVKWTKEDAVMARAGDSDSDLEIITSQSKTRKYAVFEKMPSRKAHETESHLVLRNLAHLGGDSRDKKRSSMNAAEMEASLRRAARLQAQQERQDKIEELKAKGVVIQTSEEREREQQEVENLVEKARQEGAEIQKREKEAAKKDGTYVKDTMGDDDDDDEEDGDFEDEEDVEILSGSEAELGVEASEDEETGDDTGDPDENIDEAGLENRFGQLVDDAADEQDSENVSEEEGQEEYGSENDDVEDDEQEPSAAAHKPRQSRVIVDEDDEDDDDAVAQTPLISAPAKAPQSLTRSARKVIPGLQMSSDSPMGLTQAFAATMADSQSPPSTPDFQAQDSLAVMRDLPSPDIPLMPQLHRLDSLDFVSDSQPAPQAQPLNLSFNETQRMPQSPVLSFGVVSTPLVQSQMPFEPTQDAGYMLSPFAGSRFGANTPQQEPQSTIDTVIVAEGSPLVQRKGRLRRGPAGREVADDEGSIPVAAKHTSAFDVMHRAPKHKANMPEFDKAKSNAKDIVDEAAEESEDEYAGLGGLSDDDVGEENEEDRKMIDHDTQVGKGDEAKLAGLYADRERQQDEAAVSKLLKDITTGALRRKRGVGDDLDLSDEEDEAARRREAKRREYAKMRRELFKDEAVEKISEDKKKGAFLKSIEDRDDVEDEDVEYDQEESQQDDSQSQQTQDQAQDTQNGASGPVTTFDMKTKRPLEPANNFQTNRLPPALRRVPLKIGVDKKPSTLAEIRDSVSFLIEEPDSQSMTIDLGLSDSEDEPEKYLDLDRHLTAADENDDDDDAEDLGDFIVDDSSKDESAFKLPNIPASSSRAPYSERRTKTRHVVDRLSLMRQASSSSTSIKTGGKMAFFASRTSSVDLQFGKVPSLLRRATTNSSFGSKAGREESATGVTVTLERGRAGEEKAFVRKGTGGQRNAVNYRVKPAESKMSERAGVKKTIAGKAAKGKKGGFLGGLFRGDSWA